MDIELMDERIDAEIKRRYEGYKLEFYASGYGGGILERMFDVFLKDGSRFIARGILSENANGVKITEHEYQ